MWTPRYFSTSVVWSSFDIHIQGAHFQSSSLYICVGEISFATFQPTIVCLFVCLFIWNTKYSNKVRPAGATRIIINATLDIRRFKRYSEMTIYKRPLKNENTPRLV